MGFRCLLWHGWTLSKNLFEATLETGLWISWSTRWLSPHFRATSPHGVNSLWLSQIICHQDGCSKDPRTLIPGANQSIFAYSSKIRCYIYIYYYMYVCMSIWQTASQLNIPSWEVHRLQPYFASLAIPLQNIGSSLHIAWCPSFTFCWACLRQLSAEGVSRFCASSSFCSSPFLCMSSEICQITCQNIHQNTCQIWWSI